MRTHMFCKYLKENFVKNFVKPFLYPPKKIQKSHDTVPLGREWDFRVKKEIYIFALQQKVGL